MQKQLYSLSFLLCALLFLSSCKKDKDPGTSKTKTELLVAASWKFDKAVSGGTDVSGFVPACWKDNIALFASNGTGTLDEGASVCSPSSAGPYTWAFQTNETVLHLSAPLFQGGANDFTVVSITETNLVISQNITIPPNPPQNVVFTFKH